MQQIIIAAAILSAASMPAFAQNTGGNCQTQCARGAPGPVIGAGAPAIAIGLGYGIYWLRKRRRKAD
jgi:hypothetical protein